MFRTHSSSLEQGSLCDRGGKRTKRSYRPLLDGLAHAVALELRLAPGGTPTLTETAQSLTAASSSTDQPVTGPGAPAGNPADNETTTVGLPTTAVTLATKVSNCIIGVNVEVQMGVFQFIDEVDGQESGTTTTTNNANTSGDIQTGDMQNQDYISVNVGGPYTIQGGMGAWVESNASDASYSANLSNGNGVTVTVSFNFDADAPAPNFIVHDAITMSSPHLGVQVGINAPGMRPGVWYEDAATNGIYVQDTSYPGHGAWGISVTAPAAATEYLNVNSSQMSGPFATFPVGQYSNSVQLSWTAKVILNT
jgi:hypothetical protein